MKKIEVIFPYGCLGTHTESLDSFSFRRFKKVNDEYHYVASLKYFRKIIDYNYETNTISLQSYQLWIDKLEEYLSIVN